MAAHFRENSGRQLVNAQGYPQNIHGTTWALPCDIGGNGRWSNANEMRDARAHRAPTAAAMDQTACKPGSVPPARRQTRRPFLWTAHCWAVLATYPGPRNASDGAARRLGRTERPLFGLAPGGACHAVPVARSAVGSYPTLSPLPQRPEAERRFAFCGAIPGVTPGGRYPPPCRRGARTFLPRQRTGESGRPAVWSGAKVGERAAGVKLRAISALPGLAEQPLDPEARQLGMGVDAGDRGGHLRATSLKRARPGP